VYWIYVAQDSDQWEALVNTVMNLRLSYNVGDFLNNWTAISSSRRTLRRGDCQFG